MKKKYIKPRLLCQELRPETLLCSCTYQNPTYNHLSQCGYDAEDMGFRIFAQGWVDCEWDDMSGQYCYQVNASMIFGS